MLALVDAAIAITARFGVVAQNPYRAALVNWSAKQTATADTTKDEDMAVLEALKMQFIPNVNY